MPALLSIFVEALRVSAVSTPINRMRWWSMRIRCVLRNKILLISKLSVLEQYRISVTLTHSKESLTNVCYYLHNPTLTQVITEICVCCLCFSTLNGIYYLLTFTVSVFFYFALIIKIGTWFCKSSLVNIHGILCVVLT